MGNNVCWRSTDWVSQFVQPLASSVSVRHLCQTSVNQYFNVLKRWKNKKTHFAVSVAPCMYLSYKWRRPQAVPVFKFICRHILLLPFAYVLEKLSAGDLQHGHAVNTKMTWSDTGSRTGFRWMQTKTQWSQNSNLKRWCAPSYSCFKSTHFEPYTSNLRGLKHRGILIGYFSSCHRGEMVWNVLRETKSC